MHPVQAKHLINAATLPTGQGAMVEIHPHVARHGWKYDVYHPGLEPVMPAVQEFCTAVLNHEPPARWLSFLGPSGVGKTMILKQAVRCLEDARDRGIWKMRITSGFRAPLIAHIIPAEDLQDFRAPRDYAKYDLIYIEDIGSGGSMSKGAGAVIRDRVTELLQLRSGKWTMADANLYRRDIEKELDGRIASRLKRDGSWMVEIPPEVPDYWG